MTDTDVMLITDAPVMLITDTPTQDMDDRDVMLKSILLVARSRRSMTPA